MTNFEIPNYNIIEKIGEGGMATVYKAAHKTLPNMYRAIKVMHPALALDPNIRSKFLIEAQTLASLNHQNIVRIYDFLEHKGNLILVMEFVEGESLDSLIKNKTGPISEERTKYLFTQILDAIGYAHEKSVIHRDIKPANILIAKGDEVKIIDFGIVKILQDDAQPGTTKSGTKIGTPIFMSPEQILARSVDQRSDIYALGVTLFQMVTGRSPYDHTLSEFEIQQQIVNEPLPKANTIYPAVSNHIQYIIDKATAKKKEDRFQNCAELKESILHPEKIAMQPLISKTVEANNTSLESKSMFKKPFSFDGRIRRTEYGLTLIIYFILYFIIKSALESNSGASILGIAYIPMLWFLWAQGSKRCHDLGNSGWWQIIPLYVLWLVFQDGQKSFNDFGENPK